MPRWRVDIIGKNLQHVGTVEAANEREANEAAFKALSLEPALRNKLTATKVKE
jgi:hypothetical protein